jgi:hypothetical protein
MKAATALFLFLTGGFSNAYADDFGPRHDIGTVRYDAQRLLARRARLANADPKQVVVSDVVVVGDQAILSWDIGKQHGLMGLVRQNNRWWDALDSTPWDTRHHCWSTAVHRPLSIDDSAGSHHYGFSDALWQSAAAHNADIAIVDRPSPKPSPGMLAKDECRGGEIYEFPSRVAVTPKGGPVQISGRDSDPYQISITLAPSNAPAGAMLTRLYARPPTAAEFLPFPTPYRYVSDAVMFFDIIVDSSKPVSFQKGTAFDVWFPFVLDDTLKYRLSFGGGEEPVGPIVGTIYDNVLHFELPGFTALPGKELMGEIDGDFH